MLLLAAMSIGAMAEWEQIDENATFAAYVDPFTIRLNGSMSKMWSMNDYKKQQGKSSVKYRSMKILYEYDCAGERSRMLTMSSYLGQMGGGQFVGSLDSPLEWGHVVPGTVGERVWKIACGKIWEWVEISQGDTAVYYAAPPTISKNGNIVSMGELTDHKAPQFFSSKESYLSTLNHVDFDCTQETLRVRSSTIFSGGMATGAALRTYTLQGDWLPVTPRTTGEVRWKFACGKK